MGYLLSQLVAKIIQKMFPNSQWAKDFDKDNINAKLFFIILIPAVIIALIFVLFIQLGYIQ